MRAGRVGEAVQLRELRCPRRVPLHLSGRSAQYASKTTRKKDETEDLKSNLVNENYIFTTEDS